MRGTKQSLQQRVNETQYTRLERMLWVPWRGFHHGHNQIIAPYPFLAGNTIPAQTFNNNNVTNQNNIAIRNVIQVLLINDYMKISLNYKLSALSLIVLAVNGLLGYAVYKIDQTVLDSEHWVQHTGEVINRTAGIQSISKDMETASAGFVITGDKSFLTPLYTAQKTVFASLHQLRKLTADNHAEQKRIDSLDLYMKKYLDFSLQTVDRRNRQLKGLTMALTSVMQGKAYTDRIFQITRAIQQEESNLLIKRKQTNTRSEAVFRKIKFIILILIAGLTILLILFITKYKLQIKEKEIRSAELVQANKKLFFQNEEKEKRAAELAIANDELSFQNMEKEKRAAELILVNKKLLFQNTEKEKRAAELAIANKELSFQNAEKEKRAAELFIANKELFFQNTEKEKRAAELVVANKELFFQNTEKGNRASELFIANKELSFQNTEKESRAAELAIANQELFFQNTEKEKRANELIIANLELSFQNHEKESRAAELVVANEELSFQNHEKEKRAAELKKANRLYAFISEINQNILREKDEQGLFRSACSIAHDFGKFKIAWIGLFNDDRNTINQIAQIGIPAEATAQFENVTLLPTGPQCQVVRTGRFFTSNNIANDPRLKNWKPFATKHKINSCIILPIKKSGKIIGTFNLYAAEINFFNKEELTLLVEVTADISFALDMFEREKVLDQTQNLVIKNEKRFHALIEKSADMITLTMPAGEYIYASSSITQGLGYSVNEMIQMSVFDILHPDDVPGAIKNRDIILKKPGQSYYYQQRRKHKNGNWIWCEGSLTNMLEEPGIHALVSNFRDVSGKKIAEIRRDYAKNNMDALMNNSNDLMWSVGRDFNLITSNKPFDDFAQLHAGRRITQDANMLTSSSTDQQLSRYKIFYERALEGESFTEIVFNELPCYTWSEISFCPIRNGERIIGTACHSHDVTERKLAEAERNKLVNDLVTRNSDLEQFAYVISHNLRAPVANIIGATSMMDDPDLDEDDRSRFSRGISESAKRLDGVISDLNNILTVKTKINESREYINFKLLVDDIKHSIQNLVESNDIEIIYDFRADGFLTLKAYLYSIFCNLISNSIKYRRHDVHTLIEIKSRQVKNKLKLMFIDNGQGINLKKNGGDVFGLYKRFHTNLEGKGMGLFMVKTQVEALGGKISLKSAENKGTEFTIEFEV